MFSRALFAAVFAGLVAGAAITAVHYLKLQPIILAAETYEATGESKPTRPSGDDHLEHDHSGHDHATHGHGSWAPEDGLQRGLFLLMSNMLTGVAFAFLLLGAVALRGVAIGPRQGVVWGLAGFVAFAFAPSVLLPPELPGAATAALEYRQFLWVGIVLASVLGLALAAFSQSLWMRFAGVIAILAPLLVLSPPHVEGEGLVPPELAAQFVVYSLSASALFWILLGATLGWAYQFAQSRSTLASHA